jgi:hypothetical protein
MICQNTLNKTAASGILYFVIQSEYRSATAQRLRNWPPIFRFTGHRLVAIIAVRLLAAWDSWKPGAGFRICRILEYLHQSSVPASRQQDFLTPHFASITAQCPATGDMGNDQGVRLPKGATRVRHPEKGLEVENGWAMLPAVQLPPGTKRTFTLEPF